MLDAVRLWRISESSISEEPLKSFSNPFLPRKLSYCHDHPVERAGAGEQRMRVKGKENHLVGLMGTEALVP